MMLRARGGSVARTACVLAVALVLLRVARQQQMVEPPPFSDYGRGVRLWPGVPPGNNSVVAATAIFKYQARIFDPVLVPYPCARPPPSGCASVLVLPGGGFMGITRPSAMPGEHLAARHLQSMGMTAL
eukprot:2139852-Prymnesium_polylepis.1